MMFCAAGSAAPASNQDIASPVAAADFLSLGQATQTYVATQSNWRYFKGTMEPSNPTNAWRAILFDDSSWTESAAPFHYGTNTLGGDDALSGGTILNDMLNGYSTVYLRKTFVMDTNGLVDINLGVHFDDGFAAWINGELALSARVSLSKLAYNDTTTFPFGFEADQASISLPIGMFQTGTNALTVQGFNVRNSDSDFRLDAELTGSFPDVSGPQILAVSPLPDSTVTNLTQVTVNFNEPVAGVDAGDILLNGIPASSMTDSNSSYTFTFAQPHSNVIHLTWAIDHEITDLAAQPNPFDAAAAGSTWAYDAVDTMPPRVTTISPPPFLTVRSLSRIAVSFDEPVIGVDAGDLLVNEAPAQQVSGSGSGPYFFSYPQPLTDTALVTWASGHGISDLAAVPNVFLGDTWTYWVDPHLAIDYALDHIIQISLDGLASVHLEAYLDSAPDQFPNFVRLTEEGAFTFNARCDFDISETVPNHASIFTARPVFQPNGQADTVHHGYDNNFPAGSETLHNSGNLKVAYKASMFDMAHDYGRRTALLTGKTRLGICDRSYDAANGALDLIGEDNGQDKIDFASIANVSGASISNQVNTLLQDLTSPTPSHYTFIHIAEPDLTGHATGWGSAAWSNAVRLVDTQLGRILDAIDNSPMLANRTGLVITADHGGGGVTPNGHTESYHLANYTIPFFLRAPGIPGGADLYTLLVNRGNPGTNRTDYTTQPQPIRSGDGSNLGLSLLGLPPITESFMVPSLITPITSLRIARFEGLTSVFWYDPANEYVLEAAEALELAPQWQIITNGISVSDTTRTFSVTNTAEASTLFFRLRQAAIP